MTDLMFYFILGVAVGWIFCIVCMLIDKNFGWGLYKADQQ